MCYLDDVFLVMVGVGGGGGRERGGTSPCSCPSSEAPNYYVAMYIVEVLECSSVPGLYPTCSQIPRKDSIAMEDLVAV